MQYKEVIALIESTVDKYKGDLYFGSGTLNDLNKNDGRDYPLVWLVRPVTIPNTVNDNLTVNQTFNLTLQFLQTYTLDLDEDEVNKIFNDMLLILNGFVAKLITDFNDEGTDVMTIGMVTQTYLQQDSIHVGWILPLQINSGVDHNCCLLFEE